MWFITRKGMSEHTMSENTEQKIPPMERPQLTQEEVIQIITRKRKLAPEERRQLMEREKAIKAGIYPTSQQISANGYEIIVNPFAQVKSQ